MSASLTLALSLDSVAVFVQACALCPLVVLVSAFIHGRPALATFLAIFLMIPPGLMFLNFRLESLVQIQKKSMMCRLLLS